MRRLLIFLLLTTLGCGAWVGAAGASHSRGTGSKSDFVQGTARLPESSGGGQFHFNARSGPSGEAPRDLYWAKEGILGRATFPSRVQCLDAEGNVAYIGTRVTRSEKGPPKGSSVVFRVEDNGQPGA